MKPTKQITKNETEAKKAKVRRGPGVSAVEAAKKIGKRKARNRAALYD